VAHKPLAAFLVQKMRVLCNERRHLSLDGHVQKRLCAILDHFRQRIR